jgi:hypothetical protein
MEILNYINTELTKRFNSPGITLAKIPSISRMTSTNLTNAIQNNFENKTFYVGDIVMNNENGNRNMNFYMYNGTEFEMITQGGGIYGIT